jgi:hypothetical protein
LEELNIDIYTWRQYSFMSREFQYRPPPYVM